MITFAFKLPPGAPRGPVVLVVILEMENVERMKRSDPFDILLRTLPLPPDALLRDVDLVMAYEDDEAAIAGFKQRNDIGGLMTWLERGRKIRPGDLTPAVKLT